MNKSFVQSLQVLLGFATLRCLEKVPKIFSQMVMVRHGTKMKHHQLNKSQSLDWDPYPKKSACDLFESELSYSIYDWLVVEPTHLKNISQIGNLPQFSG